MDILLNKDDMEFLNFNAKQWCNRLASREEYISALSVKLHALIRANVGFKSKFYNKVYKLSTFCDNNVKLENDIDVLFLEDGNAQYSYIKTMKDGFHEVIYICHIYDDIYISNIKSESNKKNDFNLNKKIISSFLSLYSYGYKDDIENEVKDKILNKIIDGFKDDFQYKIAIEKHLGDNVNILSNLNKKDIMSTINLLISLKHESIYSSILNKAKNNVKLNLRNKFIKEAYEYDLNMKSLRMSEDEIYEKFYVFTQELLENNFKWYSSRGAFLLNDLYKVCHDILFNTKKYNKIIKNIYNNVLKSLKKYDTEIFKIRYAGETMRCLDIKIVKKEYSHYGLNYCINDLIATFEYGRTVHLCPKMYLIDFKEFEIIDEFEKTIYKLPKDIWNNLCEIREKIFNLQEEQWLLLNSITDNKKSIH